MICRIRSAPRPNCATPVWDDRRTMLGTPAAPTLETPRLILRGWRPEDFEPYAAMLAEPGDGALHHPQGPAL